MKVLHVYRTYFPDTQGGLEEAIRQICLNTQSEGVESRVFFLSKNPRPKLVEGEEGLGVRVQLSFEISSCGFCFGGLREFVRQVAWADIVHYHFPWPYADVMYFLFGRRRPSLVTYHSDIVRQRLLSVFYTPLKRLFLRSIDRVVATSPNYLATSDVLRRMDRDVDIVPLGLRQDSYPGADKLSDAIESARASYGEGFFLFVGVLRYYKGLHVLLEAARNTDFKILIVGLGPEEAALKEQARELGLANVIFTGYLSDHQKMALFHLCRAVVFPSFLRSEAFGVTLLEGAMTGKPLISAEVGSGSSLVNIDEETGLVVTAGSPRSLRLAMQRLHNDEALAQELGRRARQRFEDNFTGAEMGRRYATIYRQMLEDKPVAASGAARGVA